MQNFRTSTEESPLKLTLENSHERDSRILFEEEDHLYFLDGKKVGISVTGFIHDFFPKFNKNKIVDDILSRKCKKETYQKYSSKTKEQIFEEWDKNGKMASNLGSIMHRNIELYFNECLDTEDSSTEFGFFKNFLQSDFMKNLVPFRTEWIVYDESLDLAGSIDMVFFDTVDQKYVIYDWKRSKEIKFKSFGNEKGHFPIHFLDNCNYVHYSLQLNTYRYILMKNYGLEIKSMHLLILHPNNDNFVKIDIDVMDHEIQLMLEKKI